MGIILFFTKQMYLMVKIERYIIAFLYMGGRIMDVSVIKKAMKLTIVILREE